MKLGIRDRPRPLAVWAGHMPGPGLVLLKGADCSGLQSHDRASLGSYRSPLHSPAKSKAHPAQPKLCKEGD